MRRIDLKALGLASALILCAACATVAPPQPPSLVLPKPPSDLHARRKGEHVFLTWTLPSMTTDRQSIHELGATQICRGIAGKLVQCGVPVGKVTLQAPPLTAPAKKKAAGSYSDTLPTDLESDSPSAFATYAVEVLNRDGRGAGISNQVRVSLLRTLPPPTNLQARVMAEGVVISWNGQSPSAVSPLRHVYRVYRGEEGQTPTMIAEIPADTRDQQFTFTDSEMEWQKTYEYHAQTVTLFSEPGKKVIEVEGDDTPALKVFADDVFPPSVPSGLQAVSSGPGQQHIVDLIWAPVSDVDLAGYNVYRRADGGPAIKVNAEAVRAPAYRDSAVESAKRYAYSVTAVDSRGNESAHSQEATETVP
jgi:hypothetical protein